MADWQYWRVSEKDCVDTVCRGVRDDGPGRCSWFVSLPLLSGYGQSVERVLEYRDHWWTRTCTNLSEFDV